MNPHSGYGWSTHDADHEDHGKPSRRASQRAGKIAMENLARDLRRGDMAKAARTAHLEATIAANGCEVPQRSSILGKATVLIEAWFTHTRTSVRLGQTLPSGVQAATLCGDLTARQLHRSAGTIRHEGLHLYGDEFQDCLESSDDGDIETSDAVSFHWAAGAVLHGTGG